MPKPIRQDVRRQPEVDDVEQLTVQPEIAGSRISGTGRPPSRVFDQREIEVAQSRPAERIPPSVPNTPLLGPVPPGAFTGIEKYEALAAPRPSSLREPCGLWTAPACRSDPADPSHRTHSGLLHSRVHRERQSAGQGRYAQQLPTTRQFPAEQSGPGARSACRSCTTVAVKAASHRAGRSLIRAVSNGFCGHAATTPDVSHAGPDRAAGVVDRFGHVKFN